jgi:hypothetical protein
VQQQAAQAGRSPHWRSIGRGKCERAPRPGSRKTGEGLREPPAFGEDDRPPRRRLRPKEGESVLLRFFLLLLFSPLLFSGTLLLFVAEINSIGILPSYLKDNYGYY